MKEVTIKDCIDKVKELEGKVDRVIEGLDRLIETRRKRRETFESCAMDGEETGECNY